MNKKAVDNLDSKLHRCFIRPHGVNCACDIFDCSRCGWNYEVEQKRKEKIREARNAS